jgi:hypothetical protein
MPLPDVARFTAVALVVSRHVINCLAGRTVRAQQRLMSGHDKAIVNMLNLRHEAF